MEMEGVFHDSMQITYPIFKRHETFVRGLGAIIAPVMNANTVLLVANHHVLLAIRRYIEHQDRDRDVVQQNPNRVGA